MLGERIGQGTYSTVWQATDTRLHRFVAIKAIRLLDAPDRAAARHRLVDAARTATRLVHPSTAAVLDVLEELDTVWVVSELIPAPTIRELVAQEGRLPVTQVATIAGQVLAALGAAHHRGLVHHDVQPDTILVQTDGRARLVDLGSEAIKADPALAARRASPRLVRTASYGPESDLRALGATLWFAVDGSTPEPDAEPVPGTAGPLTPVIQALLAATAYARPRSTELLEQLDRVAAGRMAAVWWPRALPPPAAPGPPAQAPDAEPVVAVDVEPDTERDDTEPDSEPDTVLDAVLDAELDTGPADEPASGADARPAAASRTPAPRPARRRRLPALALAVVVALTVIAALGERLAGDAMPAPPAAAALTRPATGVTPPGWQEHTDRAAGFTVAAPSGWRELPDNVRDVVFTDPRTGATAAVTHVGEPPGDLSVIATHAERNYRGLDYRRIRLDPSVYQGHPAVVWEFEFTSGGTTVRALDLHVHADDGAYVLGFQAPVAHWAATRVTREGFTGSFRTAPRAAGGSAPRN